MCLTVDKNRSRKVTLTRDSWSYVKRYKVVKLKLADSGKIEIHSVTYDHKWKLGVNGSGLSTRPNIEKTSYINKAVHVYTSKKTAQQNCDADQVVMAVDCCNGDFIATNYNGTQEAYMRVTLSGDEYDRLVDGLTKTILANVAVSFDKASLMSVAV